jgi:uncharacterized membrane protein
MEMLALALIAPIVILVVPVVMLLVHLRLRQRIRSLEARLEVLERRPGGEARVSVEPAALVEPAMRVEPAAAGEPAGELAGETPQPVAPRPDAAVPPPVEREPVTAAAVTPATVVTTGARGVGDLEGRLGARGLNRIGVLVLIVGIAFFLKHAFENAWIGPTGRVAIGLVLGSGLLLLGRWLHRGTYGGPAQGLVALGLSTLYLSGWAAHALYGLVPPVAAFGLLALVIALGVALALDQDARAIALLASLGGFLAPVIMSAGRDAAVPLLAYLAILDAGILAAAYWRRWTELAVVSFLCTQALYASWYATWYEPGQLGIALGAASVFLIEFALVPLVEAIGGERRGRPAGLPRVPTLVLVLGVPLAYVLATRSLLVPEHRDALALLWLVLAAAYGGAGGWPHRHAAGAPALGVTHLAVALALLTAAGALRFGGPALPVVWSIQALVVLAGGTRLDSRKLRGAGLVGLGLAAYRWLGLVTDQAGSGEAFLVGSPLLLPTLVFAASAGLGAWLYGRREGEVVGWERVARPLLVLAAVGSLAFFVSIELAEFPPLRISRAYLEVLQTLVWTAAAVPLLALVPGDRTRLLLVAVTALLAGLGIHATTVDVDAWQRLPAALRMPVVNLRFVSGLLIGGLYALYSWLAATWPLRFERNRARLRALGMAAALVFLLWHTTAELRLLPLAGLAAPEAAMVRNMGLSILWTLYALALLALGMRRRVRALRTGAFVLFGVTIGKLVLVDLRELDALYRILSFVVLGAVLVLASFLYARFRAPALDRDPPATLPSSPPPPPGERGGPA